MIETLAPSRRSFARRVPRTQVALAALLVPFAGCGPGSPATDRAASGVPTTDRAASGVPTTDRAASDVSQAVPGRRRILFLGNSLTAGLGVDPREAFPALIQDRLDAAALPYRVVDAGVSGETTAGGLGRLPWLLRDPIDVLFLELGANDALRGVPPEDVESNLRTIIARVRQRYPTARIVLAGMRAPPNLGDAYTRAFNQIYPRIAAETGAELIPFLLSGVAGDPALNQADGMHPTARGHRRIAETVWGALERALRENAPRMHPTP